MNSKLTAVEFDNFKRIQHINWTKTVWLLTLLVGDSAQQKSKLVLHDNTSCNISNVVKKETWSLVYLKCSILFVYTDKVFNLWAEETKFWVFTTRNILPLQFFSDINF